MPMGARLAQVFCLAAVSVLAVATSLGQQAPQPLITQPIIESQLVTLKGNTHPLAQPMFDIGAAPPNLSMQRMLLVLNRDPQRDFALHKLLDDQQDKASPNYHRWLTPDEFGIQFGPSDQDVQLVTGWLQTHGFQVNRVSHGRTGRAGIPYSGPSVFGQRPTAQGQRQRSADTGGIGAGGSRDLESARFQEESGKPVIADA